MQDICQGCTHPEQCTVARRCFGPLAKPVNLTRAAVSAALRSVNQRPLDAEEALPDEISPGRAAMAIIMRRDELPTSPIAEGAPGLTPAERSPHDLAMDDLLETLSPARQTDPALDPGDKRRYTPGFVDTVDSPREPYAVPLCNVPGCIVPPERGGTLCRKHYRILTGPYNPERQRVLDSIAAEQEIVNPLTPKVARVRLADIAADAARLPEPEVPIAAMQRRRRGTSATSGATRHMASFDNGDPAPALLHRIEAAHRPVAPKGSSGGLLYCPTCGVAEACDTWLLAREYARVTGYNLGWPEKLIPDRLPHLGD